MKLPFVKKDENVNKSGFIEDSCKYLIDKQMKFSVFDNLSTKQSIRQAINGKGRDSIWSIFLLFSMEHNSTQWNVSRYATSLFGVFSNLIYCHFD